MKEKLDFTAPHVLKSTGEYETAIAEVVALLDLDPVPSSVEYDRLEFLSVLIEAYEEAHYPLRETLTPREMVDFMLDQRGLSRSDLGTILGGRRVYLNSLMAAVGCLSARSNGYVSTWESRRICLSNGISQRYRTSRPSWHSNP